MGMRDVGILPGICKAHGALEHSVNPCSHTGWGYLPGKPSPQGGTHSKHRTPSTRTGFGSQLHHDLIFHYGMGNVGTQPGVCKAHRALEHNPNPCFHLGLFRTHNPDGGELHQGWGGTGTCTRPQTLLGGPGGQLLTEAKGRPSPRAGSGLLAQAPLLGHGTIWGVRVGYQCHEGPP